MSVRPAAALRHRVRRRPVAGAVVLAVLALVVVVLGRDATATSAQWRDDVYAQGTAIAATIAPATAVAVGTSHTCVLVSGKVWCVGANDQGQLGTGTAGGSSTVPVGPVGGPLASRTVTQLAASGNHTCALSGGQVYCWGGNTNGELGDGSQTNRATPVLVVSQLLLVTTTLTGVTSIAAGPSSSCAIAPLSLLGVELTSGVYCWGQTYGQAGRSSYATSVFTSLSALQLLEPGVNGVAIGSGSGCLVLGTAAYCWGQNASGQLGNNSTTTSQAPVPVSTSGVLSGRAVSVVAVGDDYACTAAGGQFDRFVYCWGANAHGQLGNSSTTTTHVPVAVTGGTLNGNAVTRVAASGHTTCAGWGTGVYFCWGANDTAQVGAGNNGDTTDRLAPVNVDRSDMGDETFQDFAIGTNHGAGVSRGDFLAYGWGANGQGQLGTGATTLLNRPGPMVPSWSGWGTP
jgi:alpha-tubulin suppressor-like RCC1 family protein